jgi:hypothetical protein
MTLSRVMLITSLLAFSSTAMVSSAFAGTGRDWPDCAAGYNRCAKDLTEAQRRHNANPGFGILACREQQWGCNYRHEHQEQREQARQRQQEREQMARRTLQDWNQRELIPEGRSKF